MSKTNKTIQWFAGLYEGEGCINYSSRCLKLYLGSNDEDVLMEIIKVVGLGKVRRKKPSLNKNHKQQYVWTLTSRNEVLDLVEKIIPYLGKRRTEQIKKTINGLRRLPPKRKLKSVGICGRVKPNEITSRGVKYHLKRNEKPCRNCASAYRNYMRKWRQAFFRANQ